MEKVRRESESMMEKVFNKNARKGLVNTDNVLKMLRELNPDMVIDESELGNEISLHDQRGIGSIDLEGFNQIALQFLLKQARKDSDQFMFKNDILLEDLPGGFRPSESEKKQKKFIPAARQELDPFIYKHEITSDDFMRH